MTLSSTSPVSVESAAMPIGSTLYLGDSQMVGHLGDALISAGGAGKRLAERGSKASHWADNPGLATELAKGPSKIIISLNGNGISGTSRLIKFIKDNTPNEPSVVWTGAPPAIKRAGGMKNKYTDVTTDSGLNKLQKKRKRWNGRVKALVEAEGWTFLDPYDFIKLSDNTSGYTCTGCDGVHLPRPVAHGYVAEISGHLA